MAIPKENEKYRHYDGVVYTVITVAKDPNHFFKKNVYLEVASIPSSVPLDDFNGYKVLDNGKKVKRFTLIKNLENKLD